MNKLIELIFVYYTASAKILQALTPAFDLALRYWVASVFFQSGLTKIQSWDSTLALFEYEYEVPILSPVLAAWSGTAVELLVPVVLVLGFITRPAAILLFVVNYVAAISYPDISAAGVKDHIIWGVMLAVTALHGPGRWSLDSWLKLENRH